MRLTLARSARAVAALVVAVLVVTGLSAMPASAVDTRTISGFVYLGSSATPATTGDAVVQFTKYGTPHNAADEVTLGLDGSYTITGLEQGSYVLFVDYIGTADYSDMFWPKNAPGYQLNLYPTVNVSASDKSNQDVTLAALAPLAGTVSLSFQSTPAGAGDVAVYYRKLSNGAQGVEVGPVYTDALGNYTFGPLPAGIYSLRFDYVGAGLYLDGNSYFNTQNAVTSASPVSITLASARYVGTVRLVDQPGVLGGPSTIPNPDDVVVSYGEYSYAGTGSLTPIGTVPLDADGRFSIDTLDPQKNYKVTFTYVGDDAVYFSQTTAPFSLPAGGGAFLTRNITATGKVDIGNSSNPAVAGEVKVTFIETGSSNWQVGYGGSAYTDADGNYSVSGLTGNTYFVELEYDGVKSYPQLPLSAWQQAYTSWTLTATDHAMDFTVNPTRSISGNVGKQGTGIRWAKVYAVRVDPISGEYLGETMTTTNGLGDYSFVGLAEGHYVIQFEAEGLASQSYPGVSYYYQPDVIQLVDGQHISGINAEMRYPASIHGQATGPNITSADFALHRVFAELDVYDYSAGKWVMVDVEFMDSSGNYSFSGLDPDYYRVSIRYTGPLGVFRLNSPTLAPGEDQTAWFGATIVPAPAIQSGKLVKGPGATIYMVDSSGQLIPLGSIAAATDAGRSGSYTTVSQTTLDTYFILQERLSSVWVCDGSAYLAAEGKLWPIDDALVEGLPSTELDCAGATFSATAIEGTALLLTSPAGKTYSIDSAGVKHQVLTSATSTLLSEPGAARVYKVNDYFLGTLTTGTVVLPPGSAVRSPAGRVYFVAGFNHLVPFASWDVPNSMGLPSVAFTVTQADINQATVDPDTAPLASVLVCASTTYFAAEGKLWPLAASQVAGLPQTVLSPQACSVLPKSASSISGALFVQSTAGGPAYQIMADGAKREVTGRVALRPGTFALKVAPSFLSSRPSGPPIQPFAVPPRPVGDLAAPAAAPLTTGATPTDPRPTCYSDYFGAVGASMYGSVAATSDPQTLLAECLAR